MTDRVRVLLLIPHLGGGGAERVMACVAANLDPAIFEAHLALIADDFPGTPPLPQRVTIHRLGVQRVRRAAWPLHKLIRRLRPQIILSGMVHLNLLALLLQPFLPANTTLLARQNTTASLAIRGKLHRRIFAWLHRRADVILCQSEAMADDLVTHFSLDRRRMIVVPNPIEIASLRQQSLRERAMPSTPDSLLWRTASIRIIAIGRLSAEKGYDLLLRAFAQIPAHHPDTRLAILGDGPQRHRLLALQNKLGLEDSVIFPGFQDDIASWLGSAHLFVQPSRLEGMPNALLEAAAVGLPLVATPSSESLKRMLGGAPGVWLTRSISANSLAETIGTALEAMQQKPQSRFEHAFLRPFDLPLAIAAYERALLGSIRILKVPAAGGTA
uniref:Putative Glycosyl transferase group 1 n=1 Tax=mine drainage metagenome TaxID=410659 RepID=E6PZX1_9ZZZZ